MQVKEIDIGTRKMKGYGICKKKYEISFLGGPTTPTYSIFCFILTVQGDDIKIAMISKIPLADRNI